MIYKHIGFDNNVTYYEHNLKSKKIPNIFIHGVGLNIDMWEPQKKFFKNHENIFYDLLNHGNSKKGYRKINFMSLNKQLNDLLGHLKIEKVNLIGFSLGSLVAQHFASNYPKKINKLIIIASVHKRSIMQKKKVKKRYNRVLKGYSISKNSINRWFNKKYLDKKPEVYSKFKNILENNKKNDFLAVYKLFVESEKYKINYNNITFPTLIITGKDDIGSRPMMSKSIYKKIKDSKIYIVPGAKHLATYEKSKLINIRILNFINKK
tara:strand:- start:994 stop:1785 length:792 start_codon:yes stop_codon:yes gene_type:complete